MPLSRSEDISIVRLVLTAIVLNIFLVSFCYEFDQNRFAVLYSPFVKRAENGGSPPSWTTYKFENINTMMELLSRKFGKVFTTGVGSYFDTCIENITYYNNSLAVAYSAEAAALINEVLNESGLEIVVGIHHRFVSELFSTEVCVALETVGRANQIFNGTVTGVYFRWAVLYENNGRQVLEHIDRVKSKASNLGIQVGADLNCNLLASPDNSTLFDVQLEILSRADFVVCSIYTYSNNGPESSFNIFSQICINQRKAVLKVKPDVDVICKTKWSTRGNREWETIEGLKVIWESANEWAVQNNITVLLEEAFDNEVSGLTFESNMGWWRLIENSKINSTEGYWEKISDNPCCTSSVVTDATSTKTTAELSTFSSSIPTKTTDTATTTITTIVTKSTATSSATTGSNLETPTTVIEGVTTERPGTTPMNFISENAFDKPTFAVQFSPYVKRAENENVAPPATSYRFQDIRTMMELMSTRFRNIFTSGVGARTDVYIRNFTYYKASLAEVYSAEAAALINKDMNERRLKVVVGVNQRYVSDIFKTEVSLAIESVERANDIFPGTVDALYFRWAEEYENSGRLVLAEIKRIRSTASNMGIKVGADIDCWLLERPDNSTRLQLQIEIMNETEFVVCTTRMYSKDGLESSLNIFKSICLEQRRAIRRFMPDVEVMCKTGWSTSGEREWENIEGFQFIWENAERWGSINNITIIMMEAFDNHISGLSYYSHLGWWRLTENSKINSTSGYWEKLSGNDTDISTTTTGITSTGITEDGSSTTNHFTISSTGGSTADEVSSTTTYESSSGSSAQTTTADITATPSDTIGTTATPSKTSTSSYREDDSETVNDSFGNPVLIWALIGCIVVITVSIAFIVILLRIRRTPAATLPALTNQKSCKGKPTERNAASIDSIQSCSFSKSTVVGAVLNYPYDSSYEIPRDKLKIDKHKLLGIGEFGCVFGATIKADDGDIQVALKITKSKSPKSAINGILSEIKILTYLKQHANIVELRGAYTAEIANGIVYIATELCGLGSLESYLRTNKIFPMETDRLVNDNYEQIGTMVADNTNFLDLVRWVEEIACGMEYLGTKHIVHADLATRNVLLTSEKTAKISDFGLSRRMNSYQKYVKKTQEALPWRWMAIESLTKFEFSSKSDIWSFGVTLWEMFSNGDTPYPGVSWSTNFVDDLSNGLRLRCPPLATPEIYGMMEECWKLDPMDRPTFTVLKLQAGGLRKHHIE